MRIAVLRPQVPFARGGAEIFTDELVAELRARGHEADLVSVPFKWYPGARVLTQAFLWRMLDLDEADGRPIDVVVATKFPSYVVRHREKRVWLVHQFRQAYELDGTELGQFGAVARGARAAPAGAGARPARARRGDAPLRDVGERRRAPRAVDGPRRRGPAASAAGAPVPDVAPSQGFVLSASRLDRAKRIDLLLEAAALEPGFEVVIASDGPDRERLEEIARARGLDGRVRFEGRVDAERLAELYATCSSVYYAPVDEDFGMGPYEAFLSGKPVITTTDAGGPLDVVHDRETGLVVRPDAAEIGSAAAWLREHEDEAAAFGSGGEGARRRGDVGPRDREAPLVKVAYFSPMPPEASGIADYSALLLPALREHVDVDGREARDEAPAARHRPRRLPHRQQPRRARLDPRRPAARAGRSSSSTTSSSTTSSRASRSAGGTATATSTRWSASTASSAGCSAHGVLDKRLPPLWEARPEEFPLAGEVLSLATGLVVHSRYVEDRARAAGLRRARSRACRIPRGRDPGVAPAAIDGRPADRRVRERQPVEARAAAARGLRARPRGAPRRAAPARRRDVARLRPRAAPAAARARRRRDRARGLRRRAAALGADGRLRRPREPPLADDGRDVRHGDPGAHPRQAARRLATSAGSRELPGRRRAQGAGRRRRGRPTSRRRSGSSPSGPTCARRWAPPRGRSPRREHDARAGRRAPGGGVRADRGRRAPSRTTSLRDVSEAAAEVGIAPGSPEAAEIARRLAEVDLGG